MFCRLAGRVQWGNGEGPQLVFVTLFQEAQPKGGFC